MSGLCGRKKFFEFVRSLFAGNGRAILIWNRHLEVQSAVVDGRLEGTSPEHHLPENLSQTWCFDVYIITEGI
jgi:hypothetical protein